MFGRFLDWFERHKFGVVGTLMLHTFMLFVMAMSKLPADDPQLALPEMVMELAAPQDLPPDPMLQPPLSAAVEVKNLTSNSTAEAQQPRTWPSQRAQEKIATNVEEDLKSFEAEEFNKLAEERHAAGKDVVMPQLDPSKWDKEHYMDKTPKPVKVEGLTTVSYDLVGRTDIVLEVPAYLCKGQGTVVIHVSVDREGEVTKADLDATKTTTRDECMVDNAMASAKGARFSASSVSPDPQRGNITYIFLAQ